MGFRVKTLTPIGFPAQEIVKVAEQEKVSIIAIASHGEGFNKQLFLGSTTTDVIRTSPLLVLIEKYKDVDKATCSLISQNMFKKILVPLDFSIYTDKLLDQVKAAAPLLQEVIWLSVIEKARNEMEMLGLQIEKERGWKE